MIVNDGIYHSLTVVGYFFRAWLGAKTEKRFSRALVWYDKFIYDNNSKYNT